MTDDGKMYRERAEAEQTIAAATNLPNVRNRALKLAERWGELARLAEQAEVNAAGRRKI